MKKSLIIMVTLIMLGCSTWITSSPNPQRLMKQFFVKKYLSDKNLFDGRFILTFKDQIQLTDNQINEIEKLMLRFEEKYIRQWATIKIREIHLATTMKSDHIDREQMEKTIRDINSARIETAIKYINYLLDIRIILTETQRKALELLDKEQPQIRPRRHGP